MDVSVEALRMDDENCETKLEPLLHYPKDAMVNACLKLHMEVFILQSKKFEKLVGNNCMLNSNKRLPMKSVKSIPSAAPGVIERRTLPEDLILANRKLDDLEIAMQSLLDRDGRITRRDQMADFVMFMAKMNSKVCECDRIIMSISIISAFS